MKKTIFSVEFESGSWSWGVIAEHLKEILNDYNMVSVDFNQWRKHGSQRLGEGLILSQNVVQLEYLYNHKKVIARMGGNRSFDRKFNTVRDYMRHMKNCYAVVATNSNLEKIGKLVNPNTHLIPNGIDLEKWKPQKSKFWHPRSPIVGFIGNISSDEKSDYKGFPQLRTACQELHLALLPALYKQRQIPHHRMLQDFYYKIDVFVLPTVGEGCIPEDELVFVDGQIKEASEVKVGDRLYGGTVRKLHPRTDEEDWLVIKPKKLPPITVTDNHPIKVATPAIKYFTGKKKAEIGSAYIKSIKSTEFKRADEVKEGDWLIFPKYKREDSELVMHLEDGNEIHIDEEMAYFLGWYLAEGYTCGKKPQTCLALGAHETEHIKRLEEIILKRFNRESYTRYRNNGAELRFRYAPLGRWLSEHFCDGSKNRKIPTVIMNSTKNITLSFLKGYEIGDGYYEPKGSILMSTGSKVLSYQLTLLYSKINIFASWCYSRAKGYESYIRGRKIVVGEAYLVRVFYDVQKKAYIEDVDNFYMQITGIEKIKKQSKRVNFATDTSEFNISFINSHNSNNSIIEALAAGIPVITTRTAGYHGETMEHGVNVLFCERTVESIKEQLGLLIDNPSLVKKLSIEGRRFAEAHHNVIDIANKYRKIFNAYFEEREYNDNTKTIERDPAL